MAFDWPAAAIEILSEKWCDKGEPTSEIARAVSIKFGELITRNAVIGKLNRLGFKRGESLPKGAMKAIVALYNRGRGVNDAEIREILSELQGEQEASRVRKILPAPKRARARPDRSSGDGDDARALDLVSRAADMLPSSTGGQPFLWELARDQCRYCVGDERGTNVFCGKPVKDGSSYCSEHHAKCWTKAKYAPPDHARTGRRRSRYAL